MVTLSRLNTDALDAMEEKVDNNNDPLKDAIVRAEERVLARVEKQEECVVFKVENEVKTMAHDQLRGTGLARKQKHVQITCIRQMVV